MKAKGQLDVVKADSLIADQRYIADALLDEQKLLALQGGGPETVIKIEGGLPTLPGTNIIMPLRNGNEYDGSPLQVRDSAPDQPESHPPDQDP